MRRLLPGLLAAGLLASACTGGSGSGSDSGADSAGPTASSTAAPAATSATPTPTPSPTLDPAAQAEAVRARLRAFPEELRPAAESVYDAVQPLHDAFAAFASPDEDTAQVRDDVFAASGAAATLRARRTELAAATSGPDAGQQLRGRAKALTDALAALEAAAAGLAAATRATPGADGTVAELVQGEQALRAATEAWRTAITPVYAGRPPEQGTPTLPAPARGDLRAPLSKGAWLLGAGRACGRADGPRSAAAAVAEVPVPPREETALRAPVLEPLARVAQAEPGTPQAREARIAATEGLAGYGSSTCVSVLRVAEG